MPSTQFFPGGFDGELELTETGMKKTRAYVALQIPPIEVPAHAHDSSVAPSAPSLQNPEARRADTRSEELRFRARKSLSHGLHSGQLVSALRRSPLQRLPGEQSL